MPKTKTAKTSTKPAAKSRTATKTSDPSATDAQNASGAPTGEPTAPAEATGKSAKKAKEPKPELCVFAFRLLPEERDLIHQAAGPARASRFVRALTVAAAQGDLDTVRQMVEAVRDDAK